MNNREIKFRAWDKENKVFYKKIWNLCFLFGGIRFAWDDYENSDGETMITDLKEGCYELMQFTGLHDRNGKEIYEGDILQNTKHSNQLVEVYWQGCTTNNAHWIKWGGWAFRKVQNDGNFTFAVYDNEIEVIGNIYENPDLLKTV